MSPLFRVRRGLTLLLYYLRTSLFHRKFSVLTTRRLLIVFAFLVVSIMPAGLMSAAPQSPSATTNATTYRLPSRCSAT